MSIEQGRAWSGATPQVTTRLCATIVFFVGIICVFGGYLLGCVSRHEVRRSNAIISYNLSALAENLYKKAKRISPKALHHADLGKLTSKLLEVFHCTKNDCGEITPINLPAFIRNCISYEVNKLMKSVHNATIALDSLR